MLSQGSFKKIFTRRLVQCTSITSTEVRYYNHQNSLPQLPVPHLNQTLEKYLKAVRPLVNDSTFQKTKTLVESFGKNGGKGEELQKILQNRANLKQNWLSEWWLEYAYLRARSPIVVHYSPSVSFPRYDFVGTAAQIKHASKVISGILRFKIQIDKKSVPVEKMGKSALCMNQYYDLLSTCRVPGSPIDQIKYYGHSKNPPKHITVAHNNSFFELKCYHNDGNVLSRTELETQLSRIVKASPKKVDPLGILTTSDRDNWAKSYSLLLNENPDSIASIQSSIFMLCLDESPAEVIKDDKIWRSDFALRCLHGGGSKNNSGNRWFDKTIQIVVDSKGGVGLVYEHSPAEGPPVAAMLDHLYDYCENIPNDFQKPNVEDLPFPKKHCFPTDLPELKDSIKYSSQKLDSLVDSLHLTVREFKSFGKNEIKKHKVSPDSFIQIAMQLAYYRLHKLSPSTYESASLRKFVLGRTDTIRSCSLMSDKFVKSMCKNTYSTIELLDFMLKAIEEHKSYVIAAISGEGIDRHLLGLKLAALENNIDLPDIFTDKSFERAMQFNLSTSQVSCKADLCMAFGPALDNGYGICYNPKPNKIFFSCSSFSNPEYDVDKFANALIEAMQDMKELFNARKFSSKL